MQSKRPRPASAAASRNPGGGSGTGEGGGAPREPIRSPVLTPQQRAKRSRVSIRQPARKPTSARGSLEDRIRSLASKARQAAAGGGGGPPLSFQMTRRIDHGLSMCARGVAGGQSCGAKRER